MIKYNELLYVSEDFSVREKLLKHHHDDFLAKHFDADKINITKVVSWWRKTSASCHKILCR